VVGNLLLALSYYAVLTPIGVVRRLAGRRAIDKRLDRGRATYWRKADPPGEAARYLRQF
jgi:hypothetical protein